MIAIFVFSNVALLKTKRAFHRHGMHFTHIYRTVACLGKVFYPAIVPRFIVAKYPIGVWVNTTKQ